MSVPTTNPAWFSGAVERLSVTLVGGWLIRRHQDLEKELQAPEEPQVMLNVRVLLLRVFSVPVMGPSSPKYESEHDNRA